jgi:hypothetical protein
MTKTIEINFRKESTEVLVKGFKEINLGKVSSVNCLGEEGSLGKSIDFIYSIPGEFELYQTELERFSDIVKSKDPIVSFEKASYKVNYRIHVDNKFQVYLKMESE